MLNRIPLVAIALVIAAVTASPALATTAPVGVWTFDEGSGTSVADSSGNGDNGVLSGGVSWVPGVSGTALSFDGTGQVKVSDKTALEPQSAVTVSAWVRQNGSPGDFRYVLAKGANNCIAASYGLYSGPNGGLQFYVSQGRGSVYAHSPDAGNRVWDGKWHLLVGTYDGNTVQLYVDGAQVGSGTAWSGPLEYLLPNSNDFYIGNYPGCSDHEFVGAIDDVMVWNRALSSGEIAALLPPATTPPGQPGPVSGGGQTGSGGGGTTSPGSSGTPTPTTPTSQGTAPSIRGLKLSTGTVDVDSRGHVVFGASTGLSLTYTESQAASLTMTLLRSEPGVRRGKSCVKSPARARKPNCARFVVVSTVMRTGRAGRVTVGLNQLLRRNLTPGTYRLDITPRAHNKLGKTVSARFVVRRSRAHD
jgi:hypothetical protein